MEPRFILAKSKVLEQYQKINQLADQVSYSSKTNQTVTKILEHNTNSLFSVHFVNELKHIKNLSRVIFLAQGWNKEDISDLTNKGVNYFVVDNEADLNILLNFLETNKVKINLFLRLKLKENTIRTERYFVFGMKSEIVNKKIREIRNNDRINDKIVSLGVHFHRKTQNLSEWNLKDDLWQVLDEDVFDLIDIVNIGGGIPANYANTNLNLLPLIFQKIKEFKEWLYEHNINLMIEPGRFIAAPAGKLITKIIGIHNNNIIVNASVYNTNLDALIFSVKLKVENELPESEGIPYTIKGHTPCSADIFRYRVYLNNPKVGDTLTFINAGAYNFYSNFCDLEKIETEVVDGMNNWMNLPEKYSNEDSKFVIQPIEYEKDLTYGEGAANGSKEIIRASQQLEYYDEQFDCEPFTKGIQLLQPLQLTNKQPQEMIESVSNIISQQKNKFVIGLGGDHAVTIGMVKGLEELHDNFSIIVLDAHSDFRDSWNNSSLNHACVSKQISKNHSLAIVGVRSMDVDEKKQIEENNNVHLIPAWNFSLEKLREILPKLKNKVYISIDVDVFDPSFIRNTGTPEPGGLNWNKVIEILETIFQEKEVIGADIVEFAPRTNFDAEAYSLAKLVYKMMGLKDKS